MQEQSYNSAIETFFHVAKGDVRLSSTHINLFLVLFSHWLQNDCKNPISITRKNVMAEAKISVATYTKAIYDLHKFGYLCYSPSYHPAFGSNIHLYFSTNGEEKKC